MVQAHNVAGCHIYFWMQSRKENQMVLKTTIVDQNGNELDGEITVKVIIPMFLLLNPSLFLSQNLSQNLSLIPEPELRARR